MRAIVEINGKQYEVEEGRYVQIDQYAAQENEEVTLGNVTMILAGEHSLIGTPYVEGATVKTRIKRHGRGPKLLIYKMRCKKGYRRKNGHRQGFTELLVDVLDFPGREAIAPFVKTEAPTEKPRATRTKAAVAEPVTEEKPKKKSASTAKSTKNAEATVEAAPKKTTAKKSTPKAEVPQPVVEEAPKAEAAPTVEESQTTGEGPSETVE